MGVLFIPCPIFGHSVVLARIGQTSFDPQTIKSLYQSPDPIAYSFWPEHWFHAAAGSDKAGTTYHR